MAHGFLRLMILESLRGNLHSTLQLWEMKMPSCLEAVIRKWAWNGIVLSWAWANLFLTIKLFRMEMFMKHDPPTMKQVLFLEVQNSSISFLGSNFQIIDLMQATSESFFSTHFPSLFYMPVDPSEWEKGSVCSSKVCRWKGVWPAGAGRGFGNVWAIALTQPSVTYAYTLLKLTLYLCKRDNKPS